MEDKDDTYWRSRLTGEEFRICRNKGTEPAFSGELLDNKDPGKYVCKCCQVELFDAASKYDSGSGWPSFFQGLDEDHILEQTDNSLGTQRTEIMCRACGSHLGHVFSDGPQPTGRRYCVNSLSLGFVEEDGKNPGDK